ncbi:MAG: type III polyketide synthase [Acidobacteriaceae bacterium]
MRIVSTAAAFPPHYYSQQQVVETLKEYWADSMENPAVMERLHMRTGVEGRHFSLPLEEYKTLDTWGKANNAWIATAEVLGEKAIDCALRRAGLMRDQVSALFFVSVTGVSSPSIDARLVAKMGLPRNTKRVPIFGLGCVAGAAGIARVADYVRAYPNHVAVLLSVELCSLTWQRGDQSVANLIASGLFADGAAAVVMAGSDVKIAEAESGPQVLATESAFYPDTQDVMGWDISEKGFSIVLSPNVPQVIRENLGRDVDGFLTANGLTRSDIGCWLMHTGGPKVLEASAEALGLSNDALAVSWECLKCMGNLSSASVLMVLDEVMKNRRPAPGTYSILAAMGPGFCAELVLLRW